MEKGGRWGTNIFPLFTRTPHISPSSWACFTTPWGKARIERRVPGSTLNACGFTHYLICYLDGGGNRGGQGQHKINTTQRLHSTARAQRCWVSSLAITSGFKPCLTKSLGSTKGKRQPDLASLHPSASMLLLLVVPNTEGGTRWVIWFC